MSIQEALKEINKQIGLGSAFILDENKSLKVEAIPTTIGVIDEATGIGGIPRGRITEIWGDEATGKTTLCFYIIAEAQRMGLATAFIDVEHSIHPDRMRKIGVDTGNLLISQPNSGEEALNLVEIMARSGTVDVIVVDSVAALVPQIEIEKDMGESVMGVHAKLMSQAMRKLTAPVGKNNVALIFTNQTRSKIGVMWGNPVTTTGGNALKFYASMRLKLQYVGQIKDSSGKRISGKYKLSVVKNKLAVPFKEALFEINNDGFDESEVFVDKLLKSGVLTSSGSWIKLGDTSIAQGKQSLKAKLKVDSELKSKLSELLNSKGRNVS
jgi:recombination protein RecA